jgi:hypothetical protein
MQQGRFRREDMIHHPGAQPHGYVSILIPRGVDWFCLAGMGRFWKAPKDKILIHCYYCYQPAPYAGRTLLFRHTGGAKSNTEDPLLGWGGLCVGEFEVCDIPGSHRGSFVEPHVQIMAEKLSHSLEDVYEEACKEV